MAFYDKFLNMLPFYQRLKNGTHKYIFIDNNTSWDSLSDKLKCGYENPVLLPILQLYSHYTSKVEFKVRDIKTNEISTDHPLIEKLNNPNTYQSKQDLLRQFIWLKHCLGYTYMYPIMPATYTDAKDMMAIYNLNVSLIEFPHGFKTEFVYLIKDIKNIKDKSFCYDKKGQNLNLTVNDIIPFYDLPNGMMKDNMLIAPSRLDSLKKPLTNIARAFDAKNIAIQTNGKELFTNKTGSQIQSIKLTNEEREEIKDATNNLYGLASNRSRSIITDADTQWQSLHIPLKDLGLDDSVVKDAQMVVTAFNVPEELMSYDGKRAKYENQVQATIGFIQGPIQDNIDDICGALTSQFNMVKKEGKELIGTFNHLPIMQAVENNRTTSLKNKAETLKLLLDMGVDANEAALLVGFDKMTITPKV